MSWVGLRGAVPIVLATFPLVYGIPQADTIFNVVFFIVITSVLVQGTTIPTVARWLGVDAPLQRRQPSSLEYIEASASVGLHEVTVLDRAPAAGRQLVDVNLPAGALVVLLSRDGDFIVPPQGTTVLQPGDDLLLLANNDSVPDIRTLLGGSA